MKKVLSMALALAMVLTMVVPVSAEKEVCPCGCGEAAQEISWQPWGFTEGNAETGHYYLAENFASQTETVTIPAFKNVCLDLRGMVYSTENIRTFSLEGGLTVMDSVGGGMALTTGKNETSGGFAYVSSIGHLQLCGGTVQFVEREGITVPAGGLVYVRSGKLTIRGGTLSGGVVRPDKDTNAQGGNVYLNAGEMEMTGGVITGGMALANESSNMTAYQGGNLYAVGGAVAHISGGVIENGYCAQDGGNIYIASASFHVSGGEIRGGHALRNGGNIQQLSTGVNSLVISGGLVTGGVAGGTPVNTNTWDDTKGNFTETRGTGGGGNLYTKSAKGSLTITGGELHGDVTVEYVQTLTLSGKPRITLGKSNGLLLKDGVKADISGLTGGEIYLYANHDFTLETEKAAEKLGCFKGAVRTAISAKENVLTATQGTEGYCPHCNQPVTWTACFWKDVSEFTEETHCYMKGTSLSAETIKAPLIVDMNGMTSGKEHNQQLVEKTGSLVLLDSWGGGQLFGTGSTSGVSWGAVLRVNDTSFTLFSGTVRRVEPFSAAYKGKETACYIGGVLFASGAATADIRGGVIRDGFANKKYSGYAGAFGGNIGFNSANGIFEMSGGILLGGEAKKTEEPGQGGNLYTTGKTTVAVSGGFLLEGKAGSGGNIHTSQVLEITGGTIACGTATKGGNITAVRSFAMSGGTVAYGAAENGGNLYFDSYAVSRSITGGTALGGTASGSGGNIYQNGSASAKGTVAISSAVLCGKATTGGNIYTIYGAVNLEKGGLLTSGAATDNGGNLLSSGADVKIAGKLTFGEAGNRGGNVYALGGAKLTVKENAVITDGVATNYGGNIALGSPTTTATVEGGSIYGGSARNAGDNICLLGEPSLELQNVNIPGNIYGDGGTVKLTGKATVTDGTKYNIYFKNGCLQVADSWEGAAGVKWSAATYGYGDVVASENGAAGAFTGMLVYDGMTAQPGMLGTENGLVIARTLLKTKDGAEAWYVDNASAVAAYTANTAYMKLLTSEKLELSGGDYLVDLAGQQVEVTGSGRISLADSANDSFDEALCGSASVNGPELAANRVTLDGKRYVTLENERFSAHRLEIAITHAVLRPRVAGMYYQACWECDSVLAANISSCGIGVSLTDMPGEDLLADSDTLYTVGDFDSNSVLIENIFSPEDSLDENALRGEMPVYAAAYARLADGTVLVGEKTAAYSLYSLLAAADNYIKLDRITYRSMQKQLEAFYRTWQAQGTGNWRFDTIGEIVAPADDGVMKILMIGQSHAQDTVWLLYDVLKAERPEEEFLVMDVYRSTNLDEHVQNIKNRAALYDCYENSNGTVVHTPNVTITDMIMRENWDLIVFNEAAWNQTQEQHYNDGDFDFLIDHIRRYAQEGFKLGYNATWAQPVTKMLYEADRRPAPASFRSQFTQYFGGDRLAHYAQITAMMEKYIETNDAFDIVFHSGTAIQYASEAHGVPEAEVNRSYELYRDYTHLSDFGRLMVAYQWYAQIYGLEQLTEVNVDLIPQAMRATSREQAFGDVVITDTHKQAIIASVNFALAHPNEAPEQVVRTTAILEPLS